MGSLREVKNRINSIKSTRKITSAMRLVASSKLARVEDVIENMVPYQKKLSGILGKLLSSEMTVESPFIIQRKVKRIAVVVMSSNTSLCGAFNNNILKATTQILDRYKDLGQDSILLYPIGKKVEEFVLKQGYTIQGSYQNLIEKPSYKGIRDLSNELKNKFFMN